MISISIVYACPELQTELTMALPAGATIEQALKQIRSLSECTDWQSDSNAVGVFGHTKPLSYVLKSGDRLEFYRPLEVDPKSARRLRADAQRNDR